MNPLEQFNLVYGADWRIVDPSVEANAVTGVGVQFHLEPGHRVSWPQSHLSASQSVFADGFAIVFRGQKTETLIPHLPIPPWPFGPGLAKTIIVDSKCHINCHNPDVKIEGQSVGVALVLLAPPLHCASLPVPASAKVKLPGLKKLKDGLRGMHRLNKGLAKVAQLQKKLEGSLDNMRKLQVAATAAVALPEWVTSKLPPSVGPQLATDGQPPNPKVLQELVKIQADYREAKRRLAACEQPIDPEYFAAGEELSLLDKELRAENRKARVWVQERHVQTLELTALEQEARFSKRRRMQKERLLKSVHADLEQETRRMRLAGASGQWVDQGRIDARAQTLASIQRQVDADRERCAQIDRKKQNLLRRLAFTQTKIQGSLDDRTKIQERRCALNRSRQQKLAAASSEPLTTQLAVMIPSLTSFCASAHLHSVKVGMSLAGYAKMMMRVYAVICSDVLNHYLGLLGDALISDGPGSPVSGWVAELAGGVLQGLVASPLKSWGAKDTLELKIPVCTPSGILGRFAKGKAEFRWRFDPEQEGGRWVPENAFRAGVDLPGGRADQVFMSPSAPGVDFEIPEVW